MIIGMKLSCQLCGHEEKIPAAIQDMDLRPEEELKCDRCGGRMLYKST